MRVSVSLLVRSLLVLAVLPPAGASATVGRWSSVGPPGASIVAISVSRSDPSIVYAASETTVSRLADGSRWIALPTPFRFVTALLASSESADRVLVGDANGTFLSRDGGATWELVLPRSVHQIVQARSRPSVLFAISTSMGSGEGLFRSDSGGLTWLPVRPLPIDLLGNVSVDPVDPDVLYVSGSDWLSGSSVSVRSDDGGATWSPFAFAAFVRMALTPFLVVREPGTARERSTLYVGDRNGHGVLESTDGGATFTALNPGRTDVYVTGLALDPADPELLYVSTKRGVYARTGEGADGFTKLADGLPDGPVSCLGLAPGGTRLHAGTGEGVYTFEPGGTWMLPSSAHAPGLGGAFYSTAVTVVNPGPFDTSYTLQFLGHGVDGSAGPERSFALPSRASVTHDDVLSTVFGSPATYGAIRITSSSRTLVISSQTATPAPGGGGTFGESVPALGPQSWASPGAPRVLPSVREDAAFRTNLFLANASRLAGEALVTLTSRTGERLASRRYALPPLGMVQVTRVVRDLGVAADVAGAYLEVATAPEGGAVAAYAVAIDNGTNDPRSLLPR